MTWHGKLLQPPRPSPYGMLGTLSGHTASSPRQASLCEAEVPWCCLSASTGHSPALCPITSQCCRPRAVLAGSGMQQSTRFTHPRVTHQQRQLTEDMPPLICSLHFPACLFCFHPPRRRRVVQLVRGQPPLNPSARSPFHAL